MRKYIVFVFLVLFIALPASAMEFNPPVAPDSAQIYMPDEQETFGQGLWHIFKEALGALRPEVAVASTTCLSMIVTLLVFRVADSFS